MDKSKYLDITSAWLADFLNRKSSVGSGGNFQAQVGIGLSAGGEPSDQALNLRNEAQSLLEVLGIISR